MGTVERRRLPEKSEWACESRDWLAGNSLPDEWCYSHTRRVATDKSFSDVEWVKTPELIKLVECESAMCNKETMEDIDEKGVSHYAPIRLVARRDAPELYSGVWKKNQHVTLMAINL